jgi:hypothetical protein
VRMAAISCCRSETAFSMRAFRCVSTSLMELNVGPLVAAGCSVFIAVISESRLLGSPGLVNCARGFARRHSHYSPSGPSEVLSLQTQTG